MKFTVCLIFSLALHVALSGWMFFQAQNKISEITVIEIGSSPSSPGAAKKAAPAKTQRVTKFISHELPAKKDLTNTSDANTENNADSAAASGDGSGAGDVQAPKVLKEAIAKYPKAAKMAGIEGVVEMLVTVNTEGRVESAEIIRGPGYGLNEAALEAMKDFIFSPALRQGERVIAKIIYRYRFILGGGS